MSDNSEVKGKRNLISFIVIILLLIAIPLGVYLVKTTKIFQPKATAEPQIAIGEGTCVRTINGLKVVVCKTVPLKLVSPFGD